MLQFEKYGPRKNLVGLEVGRLRVISLEGKNKDNTYIWKCLCSCGNTSVVRGYMLNTGRTLSCGCLAVERSKKESITHGMSGTKEYKIWLKMKERCHSTACKSYKDYGKRGISICDRWLKFENFYCC